MLRLSRILKDYREAGSLNSLFAPWGFIDDHAFLTKSGAVGIAFRMAGVDDECLDHADRQRVVHDFEQALRLLDERFHVYQYLVKRRAQLPETVVPENPFAAEAVTRRAAYLESRRQHLYSVDLYLVVLIDAGLGRSSGMGWLQQLVRRPLATLGSSLLEQRATSILSTQLDRACAELYQKARALEVQLADCVRTRMMAKGETFTFLRQLVNYDGTHAGARLKYDTHLDFFMSDASVECHRDHLDVGTAHVKVLTMKETPARTFAHVLGSLSKLDMPFIACLEWQRTPDARMRRDLHARRRHHFNRRVSLVNYVNPETRPDEMLVDDSAGAVVSELGACLTAMEVEGQFFGSASLSILLADASRAAVEGGAAECRKVFAAHDGSLIDESYNLLNAWLAFVPGNWAHNLRRLALLNTNVADLSFLFAPHEGESSSAHLGGQDCLAVLETTDSSPYYLGLHVNDVGHTAVLGATGSGKSFLMNFLLTHAQKYNPRTVIFDLGGGYERTVARLGGRSWRIGLEPQDCCINPFCLVPSPDHLHFLYAFVRVLLGRELAHDAQREVYEAVANVYRLDGPQRRLRTVANLLPRELAHALHPWIDEGPYAGVFDNPDDTLTFSRLQSFDFEGLERFPVVLEAVLFYVLHRANVSIRDDEQPGELKLFFLDEAWRFAGNPLVRDYIAEALKTWRKRNASMILATQSIEDFASVDLLRTVVESCPTKLLLANPGIDQEAAKTLFHLNQTETDLLGTLRPRQQFLLKRPTHSKVLNLQVDADSYWLYTNTPPDNARLHAAARQEGTGGSLHSLASH